MVVDISLTKRFADESTAPVLDPGAGTINHKMLICLKDCVSELAFKIQLHSRRSFRSNEINAKDVSGHRTIVGYPTRMYPCIATIKRALIHYQTVRICRPRKERYRF
jgi:hypothetical protein